MDERVFTGVAEEIAGALQVDVSTITPASRLEADLGAESIDLIDLAFRLEKRFDLQAPNEVFFRLNHDSGPVSSVDPSRRLTAGDVALNVTRLLQESSNQQ